jgi:comEA protein
MPPAAGNKPSGPNGLADVLLLRSRDQRTVVGLLLLALAVMAGLRLGEKVAGRRIVEFDELESRSAPLMVDVNRADAVELSQLPVIGPALAKRIIEHRTLHGPFRTLDDLRRVSGIGPKTLEAIRPHVTVGGATTGT